MHQAARLRDAGAGPAARPLDLRRAADCAAADCAAAVFPTVFPAAFPTVFPAAFAAAAAAVPPAGFARLAAPFAFAAHADLLADL
ncbi:hypothetical protein NCPPB3923_26285, partial [Burkholderia glumae]